MSTDTTNVVTAELLNAIHAEPNVRRIANELFKAVVPAANGLDTAASDAPHLCAEYALPNPEFLANILVTIEAYFTNHKPGWASSRQNGKTQRTLGRRLDKLNRVAKAILRDIPMSQLGGHLVAIDRGHDIFGSLEVHNAICAMDRLELGTVSDIQSALLHGFVIPLGEFWYDCRGEIPTGAFTLANEGYVPVAGSAASFVIDALASTSWKFSVEQVRRAFGTMQIDLAKSQAAGLLPVSAADVERPS
jgi:hypothetical protein